MAEKNSKGAGKFFLGAVLGAVAGAVAGKFIKNREDLEKYECSCDDACDCGNGCDKICDCDKESHPVKKEKVATTKKSEKKTTKKEA